MGHRGKAPTPTAILRARGSWRGEANKKEPQIEAGIPDVPPWLNDESKQVWDQVSTWLDRAGVLTRVDGMALGRYCDALVRWKQMAKWIDENGESYASKEGHKQYPQVGIYHKFAVLLVKLEAEFGLTPSSRSRIQVNVREAKPQNEKSRFFPQGAALRTTG